MLRRVALIVLFVCAGGCATRSARIDQRLILPQSGDRYSMDDRQLFLMPMSLGNEPPEFPQSLQLHDLPPTTVCAEVTISDTGVVERVTLLRHAEPGLSGHPVDELVGDSNERVDVAYVLAVPWPEQACCEPERGGVGIDHLVRGAFGGARELGQGRTIGHAARPSSCAATLASTRPAD